MKKIISLISILLFTVLLFGQKRVTTSEVNFRATPQITDNKIGKIPKGTVLTPIQGVTHLNNWLAIEFNGKTGFVNLAYVKYKTAKTRSNLTIHNPHRVKHYTNSTGERIQSPTQSNSAPEDATALCNDGSYSFSHSRRGTCSHHGGVRQWLE